MTQNDEKWVTQHPVYAGAADLDKAMIGWCINSKDNREVQTRGERCGLMDHGLMG